MSGDKRSPLEIKVDDHISRTDRKISRLNKKSKKERRRLKRSLAKKRERRLKEVEQKIDKKNAKNLNRLQNNFNQKLNKQEKTFNQKLTKQRDDYQKEMENLEGNINQKLEQQSDIFEQKLANQKEELTDYVDTRYQELEVTIEEETKKLQNQIDDISDYLQQKEKKSADVSQKWLEKFKNILSSIKKNYDYQKFTPKKVSELERKLKQIKEIMGQQQLQAVTAQASENYEQANQLLYRLEMLTMDWEHTLANAKAELKSLEDFYQQAKEVEIEMLTVSGEKAKKNLNVEYWSKGELDKLEDRIKKYQKDFANPENLSKEELVDKIEKINNSFFEIDQVVDKSIARFKNYVQSNDIQKIIAAKLSDMGFKIEGNVLENEDKREANILVMKKRNEKILTRIDFDEANNQPEFNIKFSNEDESDRNERLNIILNAINEELDTDLKAENMIPKAGYENKAAEAEKFELKRYKQKQQTRQKK